jgi:transcription factor Dp-1
MSERPLTARSSPDVDHHPLSNKRPASSFDNAAGSASTPATKRAKLSIGSSSNPRASPTNSVGEKSSAASRGLRHFSMMVCQKVEQKGTTTYNEVADELVQRVVQDRRKENPDGKFDEKNIRRRVYDALNVLMAMDIISKEKKEITWKGLPTAARQDMESMQKEIEYRRFQIEQKKEALRDLLVQQVCFRNLVLRNQEQSVPEEKIPLPFIVVNTSSSAIIQCDMSRDRTDVMFDFSMPFEINADNTILKKMGM